MNLQQFIKIAITSIFIVLIVSGCSTDKKNPESLQAPPGSFVEHPRPPVSFASSQVCADNQFLQKFDCSFEKIQSIAHNGDADAQYALGYLYYYGIGTIKDKKAGLIWIRKAARQGQPLAIEALKSLEAPSAVSSATQPEAGVTPERASSPESTSPEANSKTNSGAPLTEYLPNYKQESESPSPAVPTPLAPDAASTPNNLEQ